MLKVAHIIPWSESQNDELGNGLTLCPLCHWTFDEGLMTVNAVYRIRLSPRVTANENAPEHFHGGSDGRPTRRPFPAKPVKPRKPSHFSP